jgi:hypothetical protein
MKIWGLTLSRFLSAIIVGLIIAGVIITITSSPHEEKSKPIPQPVVQGENPWNDTISQINNNVVQAYSMMGVVLLLLGITVIVGALLGYNSDKL